MIDEHFNSSTEKEEKSIFSHSDNAEVKRMQGVALADLDYASYNESRQAKHINKPFKGEI
jgi:hypothetical protein